MDHYSINTKCVQAGYTPGNGEPRQIPIVQSTTFKYDTSEAMGQLFDLEASGYFYTRLQNPTNDHVAAKIAALEGGTSEESDFPPSPDRQQTSLPFLTSVSVEATSLLLPLFMAERLT